MNFAYFRKSSFSLEKTIANVMDVAKSQGWKMLGEAPIPGNLGKMILLCRPDWVKTVVENEHELLGFLPCSVTVFQKGKDVLVGSGQPAVIKAIAKNEDIQKQAGIAEQLLTELVHTAGGIAPRKTKSITVYSTTTCPYCKMESSWLDEKKVKHETIYVDRDQERAQEMVDKTGQMGVPVTGVVFDDDSEEFVIGFDKGKLSSLLGLTG